MLEREGLRRENPKCVSPCHNSGKPPSGPIYTPSVSKPSLPATSLVLKVEPPSPSLRMAPRWI
ncbi:hypothetical protein BDQ94DRAFT_153899 [Aspergillus welwitschiae]|uniref:Uncharacterized protein n=1 Tax=Aspergillus welwitschiae TaxID=1341132 RepID=A0A3F3PKW7_9EURO|nr:hypothetical protein BDQ94DRAFT_153899 [Aspergillus welwitschiae]RDH27463.1 hypothetical protein BDQ94DRAFT_153899 [Aspergillus welwitschiae]